MSYHKKVQTEIAARLAQHKLRFAVDSMEDYFDELELAADYVLDVYEDCDSIGEKVEAWLFDVQNARPDYLQSVC